MEIPLTPAITSFVIRIIHEGLQDPGDPNLPAGMLLRGTIRNVQTNEEIDFTRWGDAVEFIERFVTLDKDVEHAAELGPEGDAD